MVYVNDVLAFIHDAKAVMAGIAAKFEIINDKIAELVNMHGASLLPLTCKVLFILCKGFFLGMEGH